MTFEVDTSYHWFIPDSATEKITRAALKAEVARRLTRSSVVVLDSLNSIKGFRCFRAS